MTGRSYAYAILRSMAFTIFRHSELEWVPRGDESGARSPRCPTR